MERCRDDTVPQWTLSLAIAPSFAPSQPLETPQAASVLQGEPRIGVGKSLPRAPPTRPYLYQDIDVQHVKSQHGCLSSKVLLSGPLKRTSTASTCLPTVKHLSGEGHAQSADQRFRVCFRRQAEEIRLYHCLLIRLLLILVTRTNNKLLYHAAVSFSGRRRDVVFSIEYRGHMPSPGLKRSQRSIPPLPSQPWPTYTAHSP